MHTTLSKDLTHLTIEHTDSLSEHGGAPRKPGMRALSGTLVTSFALQGGGAISGVLAARLLGPEQRGQLAAVLLWPSVIAAIGIFGTNWATVRLSAAGERDLGELAGSTGILALALSLVSVMVGWFVLPSLLADRDALVPLARLYLVCWIPVNYLGLNLLALDQGRGNFFRFNWTRAILSPVYIALILMFWAWTRPTVAVFAIALLGGNAAVIVARLTCLARERLVLRITRASVFALLRLGLPFAMSSAAVLLATQIDRIIVVSFLGDAEVGFYMVAWAFAQIFSGFSSSLGTVTFARSASTRMSDEMSRFVERNFRRLLLLGVSAGIAAAILAPLLIAPVYGRQFQAAVLPCIFLAIGSAFLPAVTFMDESLRGQGKPEYGVLSRFVGAGLIAFGAMFAVPRWGITGMSMATFAGTFAQAAMLVMLGGRILQIPLAALCLPRAEDVRYVLSRPAALLARLVPGSAPGRRP